MSKIKLTTVQPGYYEKEQINNNFNTIENAFNKVLFRDGLQPNHMTSDLDMNGYNILNTSSEYEYIEGGGSGAHTHTESDIVDLDKYTKSEVDSLLDDSSSTVITTDNQFDNVADMEASTDLTAGMKVRTLGYYDPGDGGGNDYEIVAADTGTDDGGSFINLAGSGTQAKGLFSGAVSVITFGANPSGAGDSTAAIQATVNYVSSVGGGEVYIPAGTYLSDGVDILSDGVTIRGAGRSASKIIYTNTTGTAAAFSYGQSKTGSGELIPVSGCTLKDMFIDGNRGGGASGSAVRTTVFDGFVLDNVHTQDCADTYGFGIVGTGHDPRNDLIVRNCSAYRCGADGIDIKAGGHQILIDGFYTAGHLNETGGDSVGLDVRGQRISINNIWAKNCIDIGIRVRIDSGVRQDDDWSVTKDAQVVLTNCFAWECRDGFRLDCPLDSHISASNIHSMDCDRYGITTTGAGSVSVNGGSSLRDLVGIRASNNPAHVDTFTGFSVRNSGQDAITFENSTSGCFSFLGGLVKGASRYGVNIGATTSSSTILFSGSLITGNYTNFAVVSSDSDGVIKFQDCVNSDASSRGVQMATASSILVTFERGRISGNATNIHSSNANTVFRGVQGVISKQVLEQNILVDATGQTNIGFSHSLWKAPSAQNVTFRYARVTNVSDFAIGYERVAGISGSLLNVEVGRSSPSATAGAEVKLICVVDLE